MFAYVEVKTIQPARSERRAAVSVRHAVDDELPPAPDKAQIRPAANRKDSDKIATSIEERYQRAIAGHREAVEKLAAKRAAATAAAEQERRDLRKSADTARICAISYAIVALSPRPFWASARRYGFIGEDGWPKDDTMKGAA